MSIRAPHFLLMSEAKTDADQHQWRFVLASADGDQKLVASDTEPAMQGERLELLSVVRGLEALEQPSEVTLLTDSRYVSQGIAHGLSEWRSNDWCWERFGELTPVKNLDLWQRVDQALKFHRVDCRTWRFDSAHTPADRPAEAVKRPVFQKLQRTAATRPARSGIAAARSKSEPINHIPETTAVEAEPRPIPVRRAPRRAGLLAACRSWLAQAADAVRGSQVNVSYEPH